MKKVKTVFYIAGGNNIQMSTKLEDCIVGGFCDNRTNDIFIERNYMEKITNLK